MQRTMTRRQAATIIGLLIVIAIGLFSLAGANTTRGQNNINLPIVRSGNPSEVAASDVQEGMVAGMHPELGAYVVVPSTGEIDQETKTKMMDALGKAVEGVSSFQVVPASGKETAGFPIEIQGKQIKLPDYVYIDTYLAHVNCPIGIENCVQAPAYVLVDMNTQATVVVSGKTGKLGNSVTTPEELAAAKVNFKWLVDAMEGK